MYQTSCIRRVVKIKLTQPIVYRHLIFLWWVGNIQQQLQQYFGKHSTKTITFFVNGLSHHDHERNVEASSAIGAGRSKKTSSSLSASFFIQETTIPRRRLLLMWPLKGGGNGGKSCCRRRPFSRYDNVILKLSFLSSVFLRATHIQLLTKLCIL